MVAQPFVLGGNQIDEDNPLAVAVIGGSTSGTEYTEGDTSSTITGQAMLFEDAGDTLTVPSADNPLPVEQAALVASVDTVTAKLATDAIQDGTTALTPKFAAIDAATSGNNTIVAAVTGKKIRVLSAFVVAAGAVTARFESGADGTALTGQMSLAANGGFVLPFNPVGHFETAAGVLLNLELSGAVSVDGSVTYVEV